MLHYSYQYNLKIVGVPLVNENDFKKNLKEYFSIFCLLKTPILTYETLF